MSPSKQCNLNENINSLNEDSLINESMFSTFNNTNVTSNFNHTVVLEEESDDGECYPARKQFDEYSLLNPSLEWFKR